MLTVPMATRNQANGSPVMANITRTTSPATRKSGNRAVIVREYPGTLATDEGDPSNFHPNRLLALRRGAVPVR